MRTCRSVFSERRDRVQRLTNDIQRQPDPLYLRSLAPFFVKATSPVRRPMVRSSFFSNDISISNIRLRARDTPLVRGLTRTPPVHCEKRVSCALETARPVPFKNQEGLAHALELLPSWCVTDGASLPARLKDSRPRPKIAWRRHPLFSKARHGIPCRALENRGRTPYRCSVRVPRKTRILARLFTVGPAPVRRVVAACEPCQGVTDGVTAATAAASATERRTW